MHIGYYIPATENGHFTNWMPRGGDNAVFTFETIDATNVTVSIDVYHKDLEEEGPGTSAGSINTAIGTSRFKEGLRSGLKELVRYRVSCTVVDGGGGCSISYPTAELVRYCTR